MFPSGMPIAFLLYSFQTSDTAGKVIVIILFLGSILAWSLMLTKWKELGLAQQASARFLAAYRKEAHPASLFIRRQRYEGSPLYSVYEKACHALGATFEARGVDIEDLFMGGVGTSSRQKLSELQVNSVRNVAERTMADQALRLENRMGLLATATTAAPFLGLLGTVWGVLDCFSAMATQGSIMLSAVAPGISGALLTTVIGLLVALPSSIAYNLMTDRIRRLSVDMDNFAQEFISQVENHYLSQ